MKRVQVVPQNSARIGKRVDRREYVKRVSTDHLSLGHSVGFGGADYLQGALQHYRPLLLGTPGEESGSIHKKLKEDALSWSRITGSKPGGIMTKYPVSQDIEFYCVGCHKVVGGQMRSYPDAVYVTCFPGGHRYTYTSEHQIPGLDTHIEPPKSAGDNPDKQIY